MRQALAERIVRLTSRLVAFAAVAAVPVVLLSQGLEQPTRLIPSLVVGLALLPLWYLQRRGAFLPAAAFLAVTVFVAIAVGVLLNSIHAPIYACGLLLLALVIPLFGIRWGLWTAAGLLLIGGGWVLLDALGLSRGPLQPPVAARFFTYLIYVVLSLAVHGGVQQLLGAALTDAQRKQEALERARKAEAESELALHAVLDQASVGLVVLEGDGSIKQLNQRAARFLGEPDARWLGQRMESAPCWNGAQRGLLLEAIASAAAGQVSQHEFALKGRAGPLQVYQLQVYQLQFSPFRDLRSDVGGVIVEVTELTDLMATRAMLAQARRLEALGKLSGGVAHDINNMLAAIIGASEIVRAGTGQGDGVAMNEGLQLIDSSVQRAGALIKQLLAFGRRDRFESADVDVNQLVRDVGLLFSRTLNKSIEISTVLSADKARVWGDAAALEHALLNLALNAQDAMPHGGTLHICVEKRALTTEEQHSLHGQIAPGPIVEIRVSDTGGGMERRVRERMFEPFFTTKSNGQGTGLGLAAVHGTLRNHGGAVAVESEPGVGTTVALLIPELEAVESQVQPTLSPDAPAPQALSARILLADDEPSLRKTLAVLLETEGCQVWVERDGEGLLDALGRGAQPDVIITDLVMPGLSGPRLLRMLEAAAPGCPLVLITGFTGDDVSATLSGRCPHRLLRKPFTRAELMAAIRELWPGAGRAEVRRAGPV